jgi:hypothetical protein
LARALANEQLATTTTTTSETSAEYNDVPDTEVDDEGGRW